MPKIISANRLADGLVVYLDQDGSWTEAFDRAQCHADDPTAQARLAVARQDVPRNLVVDPFLVEVAADAIGPRPVSLRDKIRALGPTIDYAPRPRNGTGRTARS